MTLIVYILGYWYCPMWQNLINTLCIISWYLQRSNMLRLFINKYIHVKHYIKIENKVFPYQSYHGYLYFQSWSRLRFMDQYLSLRNSKGQRSKTENAQVHFRNFKSNVVVLSRKVFLYLTTFLFILIKVSHISSRCF